MPFLNGSNPVASKSKSPFSLSRQKDTPPAQQAPIWSGNRAQDDPFTDSVRPVVLSQKSFNKIFGIGYNKTGTNSLSYILQRYGYDMPNQREQEARLTQQCFATNYTELVSFVSKYDAFQDLPFSQEDLYVAADALFPNSRFILTIREPEEWFASMCRFQKKIYNLDDLSKVTEEDVKEKFGYLYKGYGHANKRRQMTNFVDGKPVTDWSKLYDKDYNIASYTQRNNRIQRYFAAAPEKLLVIDLTRESTTERICEFLEIPAEYSFDVPHANKT